MSIPSFPIFESEYSTKNIGLRENVSKVVKRFVKSEKEYEFLDDKTQKYRVLFRRVVTATKVKTIFDFDKYGADGNQTYRTLVDHWGKHPPSINYQSMGGREKALLVFYYFMYCHREKDDRKKEVLNNRLGIEIKDALDLSATIHVKRRQKAEEKERIAQGNSANPDIPKETDIKTHFKEVQQDIGIASPTDNPELSDKNKKPPLPAPEIDDDAYRNYPNESKTEFYSQLLTPEVEEAYFDRMDWTDGVADAEPEGIIRSLVLDGRYGLLMSDEDREKAHRLFHPSDVRSRFGQLNTDYNGSETTDLFRVTNPDNDEISHELLKLAEPRPEFLQLALQCIGDATRVGELKRQITDELTYAIMKCVMNHRDGLNQDLNAFFFDNLSKVDRFSDFTRGMSAYLRAKNNEHRGSVEEIYTALEDAEHYLIAHFAGQPSEQLNHAILAELATQKTSNLVTTTTMSNLDDIRIEQINSELTTAILRAGLNEQHFENPDEVGDIIVRNPNDAYSFYVPTLIHYNTQILKCIKGGYDATEFFERNKIINKAVAKVAPRVALVTLTPLIGLAELAGLPEISHELYFWRHDGHPDPEVNRARTKVDDVSVFGIEPAIDLLTTYYMMKNRVRNGDKRAEQRLTVTIKKLLSLKDKYNLIKLQTVSRYYTRFKADYFNDKKLYLESESHDAPSHHLYMGVVRDQFSQQQDI